mmetsp:Transcript_133310/g.316026  ORF Transcript_133310/g.316026 Transcript_133310/m.316026 type:complete len:251 (+) Transcript_133310:886-1638(+)
MPKTRIQIVVSVAARAKNHSGLTRQRGSTFRMNMWLTSACPQILATAPMHHIIRRKEKTTRKTGIGVRKYASEKVLGLFSGSQSSTPMERNNASELPRKKLRTSSLRWDTGCTVRPTTPLRPRPAISRATSGEASMSSVFELARDIFFKSSSSASKRSTSLMRVAFTRRGKISASPSLLESSLSCFLRILYIAAWLSSAKTRRRCTPSVTRPTACNTRNSRKDASSSLSTFSSIACRPPSSSIIFRKSFR